MGCYKFYLNMPHFFIFPSNCFCLIINKITPGIMYNKNPIITNQIGIVPLSLKHLSHKIPLSDLFAQDLQRILLQRTHFPAILVSDFWLHVSGYKTYPFRLV